MTNTLHLYRACSVCLLEKLDEIVQISVLQDDVWTSPTEEDTIRQNVMIKISPLDAVLINQVVGGYLEAIQAMPFHKTVCRLNIINTV